jgi:hypothetical protein
MICDDALKARVLAAFADGHADGLVEARAAEAARWEAVRAEIKKEIEFSENVREFSEDAFQQNCYSVRANMAKLCLKILDRHAPVTTAKTGEAAKETM